MNRRLAALLVTRTASIGGAGIYFLAVAWFLLHRGGGSAELAGLAICLTAHGALVTLHGGVAIDRYDRRRVGQIVELGRAVVLLTLALVGASDALQPWHLYAATAVIGLGNAVAIPCYNAMLPSLVEREKLVSVNALWQVVTQVGAIAASAAGGFMVDAYGDVSGLWAATACYVVATLALQLLPRSSAAERSVTKGFRRDLALAMASISENRLRLYITVFSVLPPTVLWVANFLLPAFADESLNTGPAGFGAVEAAWGVGALTAGLLIPTVVQARQRRVGGMAENFLTVSLYGVAAATLLFAISTTLHVGIWTALLLGGILSCANVLFPAHVQTYTPNQHLGRVFALIYFGTSVLQLLIACAVLLAGSRWSSSDEFVAMGIATLVLSAVFQLLLKRLPERAKPSVPVVDEDLPGPLHPSSAERK